MFLEESPEQRVLRDELRRYYADLLTDEVRAGLAEGGEGGEQWRESRPDHRQGRLAGHRLAHRVRRAGAAGHRPVHLLRRDAPGRRPVPLRHREHGRPDDHAVRHRGAEAVLPPRHPLRRGQLRHRLHRARGRHRSGVAAHPGRARRRHLRGERGQDLHQRRRQADYVWLAVRTDPDAPKHKGISILCVPTTAPGFEWSIIHTVGGLTTTATYYDDVRVPVTMRVGEENEGWRMITTQLNHERVGLAAWSGLSLQLFDEVAAWAADDGLRRRPAPHRPALGADGPGPGRVRARGHAPPQLAHGHLGGRRHPHRRRVVVDQGLRHRAHRRGLPPPARASWGPPATSPPDRPGPILRGRLEASGRQAQINTFGGGVNEVQREIVAMAGLGMRRGPAVSASGGSDLPDHGEQLAALVGRPTGAAAGGPLGGQPGDDPPLGRGHGRREPGLPLRRGGSGGRPRPGHRPPDHAPGLDDARAGGHPASGRGRRGRRRRGPAPLQPRTDDGPARRRGHDLGGGHQLRPAATTGPWWPATGWWPPRSSRRSRRSRRPGWAPAASSPPAPSSWPCREAAPGAGPEELAAAGEPVATMRFRILKFRPAPGRGVGTRPAPCARGRPSPTTTPSGSKGLASTACSSSAAPAAAPSGTRRCPACPECRSFEWDTVESSGRGELYSFVVVHYPQVPAFEYPLPVGLVALEEGTRLVADLDGLEPGGWRIGMAVEAHFVDYDDDLSLPVFAAGAGRRRGTRLMDFTFTAEQEAVAEAADGRLRVAGRPRPGGRGRGHRGPGGRRALVGPGRRRPAGAGRPRGPRRPRAGADRAVPAPRGPGTVRRPGPPVGHPGAGGAPPGRASAPPGRRLAGCRRWWPGRSV